MVEILVFGAGAIGSFFGGLLSQRHDVTLIGRAEHISAVKSHGLRVSGKTSIIAKPRAVMRVPQDAKPDFIFVIAKSARRVVAGTTAHGVTSVGPGEIRHAGVGETLIGAWSRVSESDLVRLRDLLADVGIVA